MVLYTNCILKPRKAFEGTRISVMSRHTRDDGKTPDERITPDLYDEHLVALAPPPLLIGDLKLRGMTWYGFRLRYWEFLGGKPDEIRELVIRAMDGDVSLLGIEPDPNKCHRGILAEECERISEYAIKVEHL